MTPSIYTHLLVVLGLFVAGFVGGFGLENHLKGTELAELKAAQASEKEKAATNALNDLKNTSAAIHQAAVNYSDSSHNLEAKLNAVRKDIKNLPKLSPDCIPGPQRLLNINAAISAANEAASR